jgi:hypothetical protein
MGRKAYYRVGANSGPGYNAATGRHSVIVLFQGSSFEAGPENTTGGANGPGATWSQPVVNPGDFAVWNQIATVIALVNAGYTVIQPAARFRAAGESSGARNNGTDKPLMGALIAAIQPGSTTFGSSDINHVYAMGISSGGFMSSRIANELAGGVNNNSTVKLTTKPFRAVAIQSASYQVCGQTCPNILIPSAFFISIGSTRSFQAQAKTRPTPSTVSGRSSRARSRSSVMRIPFRATSGARI